MDDLFLIAHKVRDEPAFDIASQIACPLCILDEPGTPCSECDSLGYWWIVSTSGHRAYPYDSIDLLNVSAMWINELPLMPPSLPDHYILSSPPKVSLIEALGLNQPTPSAPIRRRV